MNNSLAQPMLFHLALRGDLKNRRESETIFMRPQRAERIGYVFGQHWIHAVGQINGCRFLISGFIKCSVLLYIVSDVSNVYAYFVVPIF